MGVSRFGVAMGIWWRSREFRRWSRCCRSGSCFWCYQFRLRASGATQASRRHHRGNRVFNLVGAALAIVLALANSGARGLIAQIPRTR
jgi:hypothetical protein